MLANSLAVTNSVSFSILLSSISKFSCSSKRSEANSRFSLRYLAPLLLVLLVRRAKVSFTCLVTSSSLTSCLTIGLRKRSLFFLPLLLLPSLRSLCSPSRLRLKSPSRAAFLISTFSLPIRLRFFFTSCLLSLKLFSFSSLSLPRISLMMSSFIWRRWFWRCFSRSSRSFFLSSLLFFLGRVDVFSRSRSTWPTTFSLLTFTSVFSRKIPSFSGLSSLAGSSFAGTAASSTGAGCAGVSTCFFSGAGTCCSTTDFSTTGFSSTGAGSAGFALTTGSSTGW